MPADLPTLLAAAQALLQEGGADALTMDALARKAGVSRATAYRIVGSREQLLARLGHDDAGDTRPRILAAARRVFAQAGLDGATVEAIAREAGVGPVTVYRQFGSKEGLITAFAADTGPRRAIRGVAGPSEDPRKDLERVATAALQSLAEDGDLMRLFIGEACRGSPWMRHLQAPTTRATESVRGLLAGHLAAGRLPPHDPALCARSFVGMLFAHGFLASILDGSPPPDPAATAAYITALFLDGLGGVHVAT